MSIGSARRYYLGKRQQARELGDSVLVNFWQGKQEGEPPVQVASVPLPTDFPFAAKLAAGFYLEDIDLDGATVTELIQTTALTAPEAEAVLKAVAALVADIED